MAPCCSSHSASISEEILGFGRELPTESEEGEEPTPRAGGKGLGSRTRPTASAVEHSRPEVIAGLLLCPVQYGRSSRLTPYSRKKTQR